VEVAEEVVEAAEGVVEAAVVEVVGAAEGVVGVVKEEKVAVRAMRGVARRGVTMVKAVKEEKLKEFDNRREKIRRKQRNKDVNLMRRRRKAETKVPPHRQNLTPSSHVAASITLYINQ
jgi:hypothetical protein